MIDFVEKYLLDSEEVDILEAYEAGKLNGQPISNVMISIAKESMKKNVPIRVYENNLELVKFLALNKDNVSIKNETEATSFYKSSLSNQIHSF